MHEPCFGGSYALGWQRVKRAWGGGQVLTHTGSNTMSTAVVWMAPARGFAVLVATNIAGEGVRGACDAVVGDLIKGIARGGSRARPRLY